MTSFPESPIHKSAPDGDQSLRARDAPPSVQGWENEGGHSPELRRVAIEPSDVSSLASDDRPAADALTAMRAKFAADFSSGLMGQQHNRFQHRSRPLHRLDEAGRIHRADAPE